MYNQATCQVKWKGSAGEKIDSKYGILQGGMTAHFYLVNFYSER